MTDILLIWYTDNLKHRVLYYYHSSYAHYICITKDIHHRILLRVFLAACKLMVKWLGSEGSALYCIHYCSVMSHAYPRVGVSIHVDKTSNWALTLGHYSDCKTTTTTTTNVIDNHTIKMHGQLHAPPCRLDPYICVWQAPRHNLYAKEQFVVGNISPNLWCIPKCMSQSTV